MSKPKLCLTLKPKVFEQSKLQQVLKFEDSVLSDNKVLPQKSTKMIQKPIDIEPSNLLIDLKNNRNKIETRGRKKKQKPLPKPKCMARIATGDQCRRSQNSKSQSDFCSCHEKHCPHGRVNGPLEGKFINVPKKRGRRVRNMKDYTVEDLNTNFYIQTQLIKIDKSLYLLDTLGLLYSNDNLGEIVGRRLKDEIHWYN